MCEPCQQTSLNRIAFISAEVSLWNISLGGNAYGSLKAVTIEKLKDYYKKAILESINNDIDAVKKSMLATLHHCASTDEKPLHTKCPTGGNSCCFYNRAIAQNKIPGAHKKNLKTPINTTVLKHIAPIYKRLMDSELLKRFHRGLTQNDNESLHNCIWRR